MKPGLADKICIHQQLVWEVRNHADVRQLAEEALQHMVAPELMRAAITFYGPTSMCKIQTQLVWCLS